jgi:prepilin-type processing-associated H-X9-DG protein
MKKSSFTMTELIITLSGVVIFAALFIPAVSNANAQGKTAACLDNQRTCHRAAAAYANDNDGAMALKTIDNNAYTLLWTMVRGTCPAQANKTNKVYLESFAPTICPTLNIAVPPVKSPAANRLIAYYAVPYQAMKQKGKHAFKSQHESLFYDLRNKEAYYTYGNKNGSVVLDTKLLKMPDAAMLFTESYRESLKSGFWHFSFNSKSSTIDLRHDEMSNIVYADGHAASQDQSHFEDLKDNGFILLQNTTGYLFSRENNDFIEY